MCKHQLIKRMNARLRSITITLLVVTCSGCISPLWNPPQIGEEPKKFTAPKEGLSPEAAATAEYLDMGVTKYESVIRDRAKALTPDDRKELDARYAKDSAVSIRPAVLLLSLVILSPSIRPSNEPGYITPAITVPASLLAMVLGWAVDKAVVRKYNTRLRNILAISDKASLHLMPTLDLTAQGALIHGINVAIRF
jgi:hypothetical protein